MLLHAGMTKTGTTSVQRILGKRRAALAAQGVCYPVSPGATNHVLLPAACCAPEKRRLFNPNDWQGLAPQAAIDRFRRDFAAEMDALPEATRLVLLSAEQCSALLTTAEELDRLRELLAPHAARIRVLIHLRRQDSHFASAWLEGLRAGSEAPPALPQAGPDRLPRYDYAAMLDRWAAAFGTDALLPRIYERASLAGGDVVEDLLNAAVIALEVPADDPDRQANASLDPGAIALLRLLQPRLRDLPGPLRVRVVEAIGRALPGRGWRPAAAEATAFLARFAAVNESARQRWFPGRPALFAETPADPPAAEADPLDAACTLLLDEVQAGARREAALHARLGQLRRERGETQWATQAFRTALRCDADQPVAHVGLAELALAAGDRDSAAAHLARLREVAPTHPAVARLTKRLAAQAPA
jgi:hypothetical protein